MRVKMIGGFETHGPNHRSVLGRWRRPSHQRLGRGDARKGRPRVWAGFIGARAAACAVLPGLRSREVDSGALPGSGHLPLPPVLYARAVPGIHVSVLATPPGGASAGPGGGPKRALF